MWKTGMLSCPWGTAEFSTWATQPAWSSLPVPLRLISGPLFCAPSTLITLTHSTWAQVHRLLPVWTLLSTPYCTLSLLFILQILFKWWFFKLYPFSVFPLNPEFLQKFMIIYLRNDMINACFLSYTINYIISGSVYSLLSSGTEAIVRILCFSTKSVYCWFP